MTSPGLSGWYGKLPTQGDFVTRGLDPGFVESWDAWLATGLAFWRERDPQGWLRDYLAAPSLRFVAFAESLPVAPGPLACGVLMPSVDRVGRYFPLTLVRALARAPGDADEADALWRWLRSLDDLALDALQDDWDIERMQNELLGVDAGAPAWFGVQPPLARRQPQVPAALHIEPLPADTVMGWPGDHAAHADVLQGRLWWLCDAAGGEPCLRASRGLPEADAFIELLRPPGAAARSVDSSVDACVDPSFDSRSEITP